MAFMSAGVTLFPVVTGVPFAVGMVVALNIGVVRKRSRKVSFNRAVAVARATAEELYARLLYRRLRPAAYAASD